MIVLFHLLALGILVKAQEEILINPDFEEEFGEDDWFCNGPCDLTRDDRDAYSGSYSGLVTNREADWNAVSQRIALQPNTTYYFSCYMKLTEQLPGDLWYGARASMAFDYGDDSRTDFFARLPYLKIHQGWQKIGADIFIDDREASLRVFVHVNTALVSYRVDTCSLVQLPDNSEWKQEAEERITQIRMNDVTIDLTLEEGMNPSQVEVDLTMTKHGFPFGSAVKADLIAGTDEDSLKYSQCFYENFDWSVLENALKWRQMERNRDEIIYPDEAIDILIERGVPIRGHAVFWGVEDRNPDWLIPLPGEEVVQEMYKRLDYLVPYYNGKLVHWDLNNEQLHGSFYEEKSGDVNITAQIFEEVKVRDENALLFLNDYNIVNEGYYTQAYANSYEEFGVVLGAPIGAMGIQSHIRGYVSLSDITAITKRLSVVAETGLPLWITELDISEVNNSNSLADSYEDIMTLYFSHPSIDGVLLWGFSDQYHSKPDAALFEGPDYIPNESGLRWQQLLRERWNTTALFYPTSVEETFGVRAFHGEYTINVRDTNSGEVLSTVDFTHEKGQDSLIVIQL